MRILEPIPGEYIIYDNVQIIYLSDSRPKACRGVDKETGRDLTLAEISDLLSDIDPEEAEEEEAEEVIKQVKTYLPEVMYIVEAFEVTAAPKTKRQSKIARERRLNKKRAKDSKKRQKPGHDVTKNRKPKEEPAEEQPKEEEDRLPPGSAARDNAGEKGKKPDISDEEKSRYQRHEGPIEKVWNTLFDKWIIDRTENRKRKDWLEKNKYKFATLKDAIRENKKLIPWIERGIHDGDLGTLDLATLNHVFKQDTGWLSEIELDDLRLSDFGHKTNLAESMELAKTITENQALHLPLKMLKLDIDAGQAEDKAARKAVQEYVAERGFDLNFGLEAENKGADRKVMFFGDPTEMVNFVLENKLDIPTLLKTQG